MSSSRSKIATAVKLIPDPHGTVEPFSRIPRFRITAGVRLELSSLSLWLHTQAATITTADTTPTGKRVTFAAARTQCAGVDRLIIGASPRLALAKNAGIYVRAWTEQLTIGGLKLKSSHVCNREFRVRLSKQRRHCGWNLRRW